MENCPKLKIRIPNMLFIQLSKWGDIKGNIDDQKDLKDKLDEKQNVSNLGQNVVNSVSEVKTFPDTTKLAVNTINPENGNVYNYNIELTLASQTKSGVMPKESFAQIEQNTTDIGQLKGIGRRYPVEDQLPGTLTQEEALSVYQAVSGNASPNDNDTLISFNADTRNYEWTYYGTLDEWVYKGVTQVNLATNSMPGIVRGEDTNGKIFVENDGTMSLVGYEVIPPMIKMINQSGTDTFVMTASKDQDVEVFKFSDGTPLSVSPTSIAGNVQTTFTIADGSTDDFTVVLN